MKKIFTLIALALACLQGNALDYSNPMGNNYVQEWGKLKLVGNQLSSENGEPIQLRGWSTHGKNWQGGCFDDKGDFELMKQKGANLARIAMYLKEGGYEDINWMKQCIEWTNSLGMYCIVDWHILTPGNPNAGDYSGAENFFRSISGWIVDNNYKNVIYEICNEPNIDEEGDPYRPDVWEWVKRYANKILPAIAEKDKDAVVVVGTPQWDKALSFPMEDPIDTYGLNVMYTFHHYTCDQQFFLGILSGAAASIPVFVTEWGVSKDDGGADGQVCTGDADKMLAVCNGKNLGNQIISWANWSWCDKDESASSFRPNGYDGSQWSESGEYVKNALKQNNDYSKVKSEPYNGEPQVFDGFHDLDLDLMRYDEGGEGVAFFDNDVNWKNDCKNTACNMGNAGLEGIRTNETVDLGYTDEENPENGYISLGWISQSEWVKYTMDIKIGGIYEFEIFTCNRQHDIEAINKVAFALDGKNCLVEEDGTEYYKVVDLTPCHGGTESSTGYQEWDWAEVKTSYAPGKKFYLKLEQGTHVFAVAFMATSAGLGTIKFKGKPENEDVSVEDIKASHNVSIWPNPAENGNVNISVDADAEVDIFSVDGVNVYSGNVAAGATNELNLNLPAGVYSVSVKSAQGVTTNKLIVK